MFSGKRIVWFLSSCFLPYVISCKEKAEFTSHTTNDTTLLSIDQKIEVPPQSKDSIHSKFILSALLKKNDLEVQYLDSGFLNQDSLIDQVLVLRKNSEESKYLPRLTVILLGQERGVLLYQESKIIMPSEYSSEGYQQFDTEEVKIENGKVIFDLYAIGPNGHIYFDYKWLNGQIQLHEFTTYFMGAGSHTSYCYLEGIVKQTTVNTMEEIPSETSESLPIRLKSPTNFEQFDYQECLQEIITLPFTNE